MLDTRNQKLSDAAILAVEAWPGAEAIGPLWRDLEARADITFYLSWHWIGTWLEQSRVKPQVVTARQGGKLVGLGLLVLGEQRRHRGLLHSRTLFLHETGDPEIDINCIEYNGFLVDRLWGEDLERRMVAFVATTPDLPDWDEVRFGGVHERYIDLGAATGLRNHVVGHRRTAQVDLDAIRESGKSYLDHLSANTRYQTRRSAKLYAQRGRLELDAARDIDEALSFLDGLKALHQPYWQARGSRGAFGYPFLERFHRAVITRAFPTGEVELLRIRAGEEAIGYLYNFVRNGWVGTYLSGFAYEEDSKIKPGYVSFSLCVERHLAGTAHVVDFLAGELRYKTSLGTPSHAIVNFDLQKPRLKLRVEDAGRAVRNRLRQRAST